MAKTPESTSSSRAGGYKDKPWIPRAWNGITTGGWIRLLLRNRFRVNPLRIPMGLIVLWGAVFVNFPCWLLQGLILGRKIRETKVESPPIFIVGHWRTGTTLLHELMVRDSRHTFPTAYQCFAPNHFLISRSTVGRFMGLFAPSRRPQDDMPFGLDRPQEDEFALCNMGLPSPYLTMAFPNHPPQCQEYLDMEGVAPESLGLWKQKFEWFLRCITLKNPKRIVLKSPAHLGRIRTLLEVFPEAKFIHIHRDPYVVFPSTVRLWTRLYSDSGLQLPKYQGLDEHILTTFNRLYAAFERDRELLGPSQLAEVSYESLVADPVEAVSTIYKTLDLGQFDSARPAVEEFIASQAGYQTNRYEISAEIRQEITHRWAAYIEKYGYAPAESEA